MVYAAETNIIAPAVATEDPLRLLRQEVLLKQDLLGSVAAACLKGSNQLICSGEVGRTTCEGIQPSLAGSLYVFLIRGSTQSLNLCLQAVTDSSLGKKHTITELCIVLKEGVAPCRALSLGIDRVRSGR